MQWLPALNDLIQLLSGLYPDPDRARLAMRRAGLDPGEINLAGSPKVVWLRIVEEAERQMLIDSLIHVMQQDFPRLNLTALRSTLREPAAHGIDVTDDRWKGARKDPETLERITGNQPTFLPIIFLSDGLHAARPVGCVRLPGTVGTGFLLRGNILLTNHHVIPNAAAARNAAVWFNFETQRNGASHQISEYRLEPRDFFATSPLDGGDDWTAVRVAGAPNEEWGSLELADVDLAVEDFVNIIQHPGGLPKQIALYHNVVVFADKSRVQYLTDTMPGSSGSPVFNSEWKVVALHHSGGWIPEPGRNTVFFRNEGIHSARVLDGLQKHGVSVSSLKQ